MRSGAELCGDVIVSRETLVKLKQFLDLLNRWNQKINLVSKASLSDAWQRHIVDSAQLWPLAPKDACLWLDIGSGGGLPGIVISVIASEKRPDLRVRLVESDLRKSAFLSTVVRDLDLNADVVSARIEDLSAQNADIVSARALAPLKDIIPMIVRHMRPQGCAILPKGNQWATELEDALAFWRFSYETRQSQTAAGPVVLKLKDISGA